MALRTAQTQRTNAISRDGLAGGAPGASEAQAMCSGESKPGRGSRSGTEIWKAALPWRTATKSTIRHSSSARKARKAAGVAKSSRHACPGSRGQAQPPRPDSGTGHSFRASPVRLASWLLSKFPSRFLTPLPGFDSPEYIA